MRSSAPTPKQLAVLEFIADQIRRRGYAPTHREIGDEFGIRSTNCIHGQLRIKLRKGLLHFPESSVRARSLRLTDAGRALAKVLDKVDGLERPSSFSRRFTFIPPASCGLCGAERFDAARPCFMCRIQAA